MDFCSVSVGQTTSPPNFYVIVLAEADNKSAYRFKIHYKFGFDMSMSRMMRPSRPRRPRMAGRGAPTQMPTYQPAYQPAYQPSYTPTGFLATSKPKIPEPFLDFSWTVGRNSWTFIAINYLNLRTIYNLFKVLLYCFRCAY